jgi:hypothetical protein
LEFSTYIEVEKDMKLTKATFIIITFLGNNLCY